jgi:molybdate transport system substrate-binding protein
MKKLIFALLLVLPTLEGFCQKTVRVAAAANLQYVLDLLKPEFEKQTGITVQTTFGASGKLSAQIAEGAPFDLLVSADMQYPEDLYKKGFATTHPKVYAVGVLVMWTRTPHFDFGKDLDALLRDDVHKVAAANPAAAPYGQAAIEAMKYFHVYDHLGNKVVYGENISQTAHFVETRAAEIGFIAKSLTYLPEMDGKGTWVEVAPGSYTPINQGVVVLKNGHDGNGDAAQKFYAFLFSKTAQDVFRKYGYNLPAGKDGAPEKTPPPAKAASKRR